MFLVLAVNTFLYGLGDMLNITQQNPFKYGFSGIESDVRFYYSSCLYHDSIVIVIVNPNDKIQNLYIAHAQVFHELAT